MKMYAYVQKFYNIEGGNLHGVAWYDRDDLDHVRVEDLDIEIKQPVILRSTFQCAICGSKTEMPSDTKTVDGLVVCNNCRDKVKKFEADYDIK